MSSKVILLKYLPQIYDPLSAEASSSSSPERQQNCSSSSSCDKTAILVQRVRDGYLSIQGYPLVHQSEKHKAWSIFQQSAKELLGISMDTPICTRFADPPHETVGSMSALLGQPSHVINLQVQPIQCKVTSNLSPSEHARLPSSAAAREVTKDGKDPYFVFREKYCNNNTGTKSRRKASVREKCDFAEMNRLISQLAEVNVYLQHTKRECELIEKRCQAKSETEPPSKMATTTTTATAFSERAKFGKRIEHSASSSSYSSDSGKGSMVDPEALEEEEGEEGEGEGVDCGEGAVERVRREPAGDGDEEVERLLKIAQNLNQRILRQQQKKGKSPSCVTTPSSQAAAHHPHHEPTPDAPSTSPDAPSTLPDAPSQVEVRGSFRHGGAYVMWDPVSTDGQDRNRGFKVLGYQVYLDQQLQAQVGGALTSQVELNDMKDGDEYLVQVCTECEGISSLLTMPLIYRHQETNKPLSGGPSKPHPIHTPLNTASPSLPSSDQNQSNTSEDVDTPLPKMSHCQVAKVHTWLENKSYSDLDEPVPDHTHQSKDHTSLNDGHAPLHVRFADELCTCADDAKSIGSSHTSGIVTDYPSSPKLAPACCCGHCNPDSKTVLPTHCNTDELSMPSLDTIPLSAIGNSSTSISSDSTLRAPSLSQHSPSVDTVIDEPDPDVNPRHIIAHPSSACERRALSSLSGIQQAKTRLSFRDSHAKSVYGTRAVVPKVSSTLAEKGRKKGGKLKGIIKNGRRKVPEAPRNVCVSCARGCDNSLWISWDPVKRDKSGCSNGHYVLGYRVYINDKCVDSVDGALTVQTRLTPPTNISTRLQNTLIYVRTRSMSAESLPSNTVTYPTMHHQQRHDHIPLNSLLATYV